MECPVILVLRPSCRFSEALRVAGCKVVNLPVIETRPVCERDDLRERLKVVDDYDGLFFTSPVSARVFVEEFADRANACRGRIYVLGERAKVELEGAGFRPVFLENANTVSDLLSILGPAEFQGKRFLFLSGNRSLRTIPESLGGIAEVDEVVAYETVEVHLDDQTREDVSHQLRGGMIDWACFFSPSAVDSFFGQLAGAELSEVRFAAIGTTTANRLIDLGFEVGFVSRQANSKDFAEGLLERIYEVE